MGAAMPEPQSISHALDAEMFKYVADVLVQEAGVLPMLHRPFVTPILRDGAVAGVITESKAGREAILARRVVDATGIGDCHFWPHASAGGVLVLDVREWTGTLARKTREPIFRRTVATERGTLTFTSVTELNPNDRQLIVTERHTLNDNGHERSSDYTFVMQCWTRDELDSYLTQSGFVAPAYFGAYDIDVAAGTTDRFVAVAQLA